MSEFDTAPSKPGFEQADPTCLCGDPKSGHRLGRKGCKALDCGCAAFEAADDVAEKERVNRALIPVLEDNAERLRAELGEQSTSARLRAAEAKIALLEGERDLELDKVVRERDSLVRRLGIRFEEKTKAEQTAREAVDRALELAARVGELEQLLADAGLKLVQQGNDYSAELVRLQVLLEDAQAKATEVAALRIDPPVEIHGWDAWQCLFCGSRYRLNFDHEHGPLTAVRVSITQRTNGTA